MRRNLALAAGLLTSTTGVLVAPAVLAQMTEVTDVQVNPQNGGIEVILTTTDGDRPQIFTVNRGNSLVADVINTTLTLADGNGFLQNDPAPGIAAISVTQLDSNSIRVKVDGSGTVPVGQVSQDNGQVVFSFNAGGEEGDTVAVDPAPEADVAVEAPPPSVPTPEAEDSTVAQASDAADAGEALFEPRITIDGLEARRQQLSNAAPTNLQRAIAPPVGDIAVSTFDPSPQTIILGTSEILPRLVLRDAPVREVLSLLARAAGLNLAYVGSGPDGEELPDINISLDIENEPIQDVFNYVVRLSNVEASRFGRTIFVGPQLPNSARQTVVRNLRLNQVDVSSALNFLVGMGAETAVSRERLVTFINAVEVGEGSDALTQTETATVEQIDTQRIDYEDSEPLLRGLVVVGDERTNSVTLVGSAKQVEMAISQLIPLDVRRRQVAVNVRVVDVDLNAVDRASSSFSFGIDDTRIINSNGVGLINFDEDKPAEIIGLTPDTIGSTVIGDLELETSEFDLNNDGEQDVVAVLQDLRFPETDANAFAFTRDFLAQLQFAVTTGDAKILTDPTLVVQEGQQAEVVLADEVITNVEIETEGTGADRTQTVTVETEPAGVILRVQVDRIDDNGFINLSVAPTVSSPGSVEQVTVEGTSIDLTLLSERRLTSGQLRIRDGQTLILSGIIQDSDRTTITKIPILGDLPIIGTLFRRTQRDNERREVVIVMTADVLDDSEFSDFGYGYVPSPEARDLLTR